MKLSFVLSFGLPLLVFASPWPQASGTGGWLPWTTNCNKTTSASSTTSTYSSTTTTVAISGTLIVTANRTLTTLSSTTPTPSRNGTRPTTTEDASRSVPTAPFTVAGVRSGSAINLAPMVARNHSFFLSGETASYCPWNGDSTRADSCPPGDITAFYGACVMSAVVPGGQSVYVTPGGIIRYTPAHSARIDPGSIICPFTYNKQDQDVFGVISTSAFGAQGLMACPTEDDEWQVYASLNNATVPSGDVNDCVGFLALTSDYNDGPAAWQYC